MRFTLHRLCLRICFSTRLRAALFTLCLLLSLGGIAQAQLTPTNSVSGAFTAAGGSRTYTWTIDQDLDATLSLTSAAGLAARGFVFDPQGNQLTYFDSGTGGTGSAAIVHLGPGAYSVRVDDLSGTAGTFTLASVRTLPLRTNDTEPNDGTGNALTLTPTTTSRNGHLGYSRSTYGAVDPDDFYKLTSNEDGDLAVSAIADPTLALRVFVYDAGGNQITYFDSGYGGTAASSILHVGINQLYYVRLQLLGGYGGYRLSTTVNVSPKTSDTENNDTFGSALSLPQNTTNRNGRLGYSRATYGEVDPDDFYFVTTNANGDLAISVKADATLALRVLVYDAAGNQITYFDSGYGGTAANTILHIGKAQGYYIRLQLLGGYGGYLLSTSFVSPNKVPDNEPNDTFGTALTMAPNSVNINGLLGYSRATYGEVDPDDFYKFTPTEDGNITFSVKADATLALRVLVYDAAGNQITYFDSGYGGTAAGTIVHLGSGQLYYARLQLLGGYGGYLINSTYTISRKRNDPEVHGSFVNNDGFNSAIPLQLDVSDIDGRLGYSRDTYGNVDSDDFYTFVAPFDGDLNFTVTADSTQALRALFYDGNGNQVTYVDTGTGGTASYTFPHLGGGQTYYVRIQLLGGYGGYRCTTSYPVSYLANDAENNDGFASAIANSSLTGATGHLGFSRDTYGNVDSDDFYRTAINGTVKLQVSPGLAIRLIVYDINGNQLNYFDSGYGGSVFVTYTTGATYYLRMQLLGGYGSYVFNASALSVLAGVVTLESVPTAHAPVNLSLKLHPTDNSGDLSYTITNGAYVRINLPRKTYNITFQGDRWLRRILKNVDLTAGNSVIANVFLKAGDANGNNVIDVDDLTLLLNSFNSVKGDGTYERTPTADFNLDNKIDVDDLSVLLNNYNTQGDTPGKR